MEKLHKHEHTRYRYNKKVQYMVGDQDMITVVIRSDRPNKIEAFSVCYSTEIDTKLYTVRRHCWMPDHDKFHTHLRTSIKKGGRKAFRIYYAPEMSGGVKRALDWSRRDMNRRWYEYKRNFAKLVRRGIV